MEEEKKTEIRAYYIIFIVYRRAAPLRNAIEFQVYVFPHRAIISRARTAILKARKTSRRLELR